MVNYTVVSDEERDRMTSLYSDDDDSPQYAALPPEKDPLTHGMRWDNIHHMFGGLARADLCSLSAVNQELHQLVAYYFMRTPLLAAQMLEIAQFDLGNAFRLIHKDEEETNYLYLLRQHVGAIPSTGRYSDVLLENKSTFTGPKCPHEDYFIDNAVSQGERHEFPVHFFQRMVQALTHSAPEVLQFNNLAINDEFLERFDEFIKLRFKRIVLLNVVMEDDFQEQLLFFILTKKFSEVEVLLCDYQYAVLMDANFIQMLAEDPNILYRFIMATDKPGSDSKMVTAPEDFAASTLVRFQDFRHHSLIVTADPYLLEAMLVRLDREVAGSWRLLVDKRVDFKELMSSKAGYTIPPPKPSKAPVLLQNNTCHILKDHSKWSISIRWAKNQSQTTRYFLDIFFCEKIPKKKTESISPETMS